MRTNHLWARSAARYAALAPFTCLTATLYAVFAAFRSFGTSQATWATAAEGILHAFAATIVLVLTTILLVTIYELVKGPGGNNSAA